MKRLVDALFDDSSTYVDHFGWLLVVTSGAIITQMLFDLKAPTESVGRTVGALIVTMFVVAMLVLSFRASGMRRRWIRVAEVVGLISIAAMLLIVIVELIDPEAFSATDISGSPSPLWLLFAVVSPLAVIRRLTRHRTVGAGTLLGAVSAYLLIANAFNYAFLVANSYESVPFFGTPEPTTGYMYFSLTTVTTLGYGDLTPITVWGRLLATTEAVIGQVFLVTFVAMIVGLLAQQWLEQRRRLADDADRA